MMDRGHPVVVLISSRLLQLWAALPRGRSLSPDVWDRRHRAITLLLWLHAIGLGGFSFLTGQTVAHSLVEGGVIAVSALLGAVGALGRRLRSAIASLGLVTASAVLVHLSGGYIEMHFHFFVMVGLLALYQDWTPFLLAIGFVALHHGVVGVLNPSSVYNHPAAWARPWTWAGIHAVFVLAASGVHLIAWRLNETVQGRLRESHAELERQALELSAKNGELDSFVYSVSHDLKAPLVAIEGMAGALLEDYSPQLDDRARHYLGRLQRNVEQMEHLIRDLLALARIGRESQAAEPVELAVLVDDIVLELAEPIRARGVKVIVANSATLVGIRTQLAQVMTNLIGNSVKYAGEAASPLVEVGVVDRGRFVECYVRDNGIGIDPAHHEKVFEIFQRINDVQMEGTGVGLAIVKKVIDGVGGRVWVESSRGEGATFRFTWPASPEGGRGERMARVAAAAGPSRGVAMYGGS